MKFNIVSSFKLVFVFQVTNELEAYIFINVETFL